jgi:hypothetical protein
MAAHRGMLSQVAGPFRRSLAYGRDRRNAPPSRGFGVSDLCTGIACNACWPTTAFAISLWRAGSKSTRGIHCPASGQLLARQPRPIGPEGCDLLSRRHRSRRMAGAQGPGARLASILKGRYDGAQRDAERVGRGIWKGSYVEPWLYRAFIHANGKPSACSDDANAHP